MFVLNANNNQDDLGTISKFFNGYSTASTHRRTFVSGANTIFISDFFSKVGTEIFYCRFQFNSFYMMKVEFNAIPGVGAQVALTLSGFGTMTTPQLYFGQFKSGGYFVYVKANGGSATLDNGGVYNVTISGTTATLGSKITDIPTVAGKTLLGVFGHETNIIYAFYNDNTTYDIDSTQKRNGTSRTTMTGNAIASNVGLAKANHTTNLQRTRTSSGIGKDFSRRFFWLFCNLSSGACVFDTETEEWKVMSGYKTIATGGHRIDQSGSFQHQDVIYNTNGEVRPYAMNLSVADSRLFDTSFYEMGIYVVMYGTTNYDTYYGLGVFVGNGFRLRRNYGTGTYVQGQVGCIYSTDGGNTRRGTEGPLQADNVIFGIRGNLVACPMIFTTTAPAYNSVIQIV